MVTLEKFLTRHKNTGVFNTNDINNLSQETPAKWRQEFIVMDFFACAGGGGGGGGSFQHGSGSTLGGGGGGGEATLQENNNTYFKLGTTYAITIGAGGAKDFAQYKEATGFIRGLETCLNYVNDLSRNQMEDDDD